MDQDQYDKLYEAINQFMFSECGKENGMPTFSENRHVLGVMKIRCTTPASKHWLLCAVPYIPKLWNGMTLKDIDFNDLPRPKKLLGFFKNCTASNEHTLT